MLTLSNTCSIVALIWLVLGSFICSQVICARRVIFFSTNLYENGLLKPEFSAFARRDARDLPALPVLILRSFTVGVFSSLIFLSAVLLAGVFAAILPQSLLAKPISLCSRMILLASGISINERGRRASLSEAPCIVANHNSAFDIIILLTQRCCFVSMDGVRNLPIVGKVAEAIGCIFVARDSKDSRQNAKEHIAARLKSQLSGESRIKTQLVVFPEGSTNNGYAILQFRRGAFEPNVPIQPLWIEFQDHALNFTVLTLTELASLACTLPAREITLHWCPVIQPDSNRNPEATADLARNEIANLTSAYGHAKLQLMDAAVSHRDAIACANFMRERVQSTSRKSD